MLQLVEMEPSRASGSGMIRYARLGKGQEIELDMAKSLNLKIFQVYCPEENGFEYPFSDCHMNIITAQISKWYDDKCQDMSDKVIRQSFDPTTPLTADDYFSEHPALHRLP